MVQIQLAPDRGRIRAVAPSTQTRLHYFLKGANRNAQYARTQIFVSNLRSAEKLQKLLAKSKAHH